MTIAGYSIATAPLLPWAAIIAFAALAVLVLAFGAWRRARGLVWRVLALALLLLILANPSLVEELRQPQSDVAAVVVDDSPSMRIGERQRYAAEALQRVTDELRRFHDLDVRIVHAGAPDPNAALADDGTRLYTALNRAVADVPRERVAGAVMITDGEVHDVPPTNRLAFKAQLPVLLTGKPGEAELRPRRQAAAVRRPGRGFARGNTGRRGAPHHAQGWRPADDAARAGRKRRAGQCHHRPWRA
jgi:hypothetical protein